MFTKKASITVPSSMDEITLGRYQQFIKETDVENATEELVANKIIEVFCNIPKSESYKMKVSSLFNISNKIAEVLNQKPSLITKFKMGDTTFGFIPKLDDMTMGEYVDLDSFITDWSTMHQAMAVLYRPIKQMRKGKYVIHDYDGDTFHESMKDMPLSVAMSSMLFFYRLENDLLKSMTDFSEVESQKKLATLEDVGVGINHSTN